MISINVTVHNKGFLIRRVLEAIRQNTIQDYELILVLDGCTDDSEQQVNAFLYNFDQPYKTIWSDNVNETKANNLAARQSSGEFIIIVQDDQVVNEMGWDWRILEPFQFSDVFSVSGNCAHDWTFTGLGPDIIVDVNHVRGGPRDLFTIRTTSNRGPLAIRHEDFEKLGYFDEAFCPMNCDDHDLHYRAWKQMGKVTGHYDIDVISEFSWGATRQPGAANWLVPVIQKNMKLLWQRHSKEIMNHRPEVRQIR